MRFERKKIGSYSKEEVRILEQELTRLYGRDAVHLYPYIDGYMFLYKDPFFQRDLDKRGGFYGTDILKHSFLSEGCRVVTLPYKKSKNQNDLVECAERLQQKIKEIISTIKRAKPIQGCSH